MSKKTAVPQDPTVPYHQRQRQRRYHQRSRNGCLTCKKRHVRCDEARPSCMNCLRTGGECGYTDPFVSFVGPSTEAVHGLETRIARRTGQVVVKKESPPLSPTGQIVRHGSTSLLDMTPKDTLAGFLMPGSLTKLPARSRWLFHMFAQRSIQDRFGIPGPKESFVVRRALADPGALHVCLSLSAIQWLWSTRDWDSIKLPLQYHKVEAYRYVRQQIENPNKADNDTTISTVASLALLEASLWEIKGGPAAGSIQNILTHIMGLRKIIETYLMPRDSEQSLFQRTVQMATSCIQDGIAMLPAVAEEIQEDVYQPLLPSILFMSLFPNPLNGWWNSEVKPEAKPWFGTDHGPGGKAYRVFNDVPSDPVGFLLFLRASRNAYYTAFLYMCMMLRRGVLSSFILHLLIDQVLDDAGRTEPAFLAGRCNRDVWFWTMMIALTAVDSAPAENKLEAMHIQTWRKAICSKIRLANSVMGLNDWESAKAHLRMVAWADGFEADDEIRQMWEDIKREEFGRTGEQDQTVHVLLNNPTYEITDRTALWLPEDGHLATGIQLGSHP